MTTTMTTIETPASAKLAISTLLDPFGLFDRRYETHGTLCGFSNARGILGSCFESW
jgi:hypothetical protein